MKKFLLFIVISFLPVVTLAQTTVNTFHKTLPFLSGSLTTENFIQALYNISIAAAAILVVVRLIWGGVQYMLSDVVTTKSSAVKQMQGALLGLLIIIGAVTFLQTINPSVLRLNVVGTGTPVNIGDGKITTGNSANYFEPGDTIKHKDMVNHCKTAVNKETCMQDYMNAIEENCLQHGGERIERRDDWWDGTIYTCV